MIKPKTLEDTGRFVSMVAEKQGWVLLSERVLLGFLVEGLTVNWNRYGFYQCPCRDSYRGDREKDGDIVCPCAYCRPDQAEYGHCFCGLYQTKDFAAKGKDPGSIPERRPASLFPSES